MSERRISPEQVIGLLIALGAPALIVWARTSGLAPTSSLLEQRLMSTVAFWGASILLLIWVVIAEQRPLSSIGLGRPNLNSAGWGLGAGVAITVLLLGGGWAVDQLRLPETTVSSGLSTLPLVMRVALVVTSGFAEELMFVGYPISRLLEITRSRWVAGLVPAVAFVLLHVPGRGPAEILNAVFAAALFTGLFLWRKDLWTNIVAHTLVDVTPLLIVPAVMQAMG